MYTTRRGRPMCLPAVPQSETQRNQQMIIQTIAFGVLNVDRFFGNLIMVCAVVRWAEIW